MPRAIELATLRAGARRRLGAEIAVRTSLRLAPSRLGNCGRNRGALDTHDIAMVRAVKLPTGLALSRSLTLAHVTNHRVIPLLRRTWN
jgi:hypothetical protein